MVLYHFKGGEKMDIHVSNKISKLSTDIENNFENLNARLSVLSQTIMNSNNMNDDITNLELLDLLGNSNDLIHNHIDQITAEMKNTQENTIKIKLKCPHCNCRLHARVVVREGLQVLNLKCIDDKCYLTRIQNQQYPVPYQYDLSLDQLTAIINNS